MTKIICARHEALSQRANMVFNFKLQTHWEQFFFLFDHSLQQTNAKTKEATEKKASGRVPELAQPKACRTILWATETHS